MVPADMDRCGTNATISVPKQARRYLTMFCCGQIASRSVQDQIKALASVESVDIGHETFHVGIAQGTVRASLKVLQPSRVVADHITPTPRGKHLDVIVPDDVENTIGVLVYAAYDLIP